MTGHVEDAFANFRKLRSAGLRVTIVLSWAHLVSCTLEGVYSELLTKSVTEPPQEPPQDVIEAASSTTIDMLLSTPRSPKSPRSPVLWPSLAIAKLRRSAAFPESFYNHGVLAYAAVLQGQFLASGHIPDDWKKNCSPILQRQRRSTWMQNYRKITLLTYPGKVFAHSWHQSNVWYVSAIRRIRRRQMLSKAVILCPRARVNAHVLEPYRRICIAC